MSHKHPNRGLARNQEASVSIQAQMSQWAGPLPHPDALERYNQIVPTAAERILAMAESQHDHRLSIEKQVIDSNLSAQKLGTILGFIVAMTAIFGGVFLAYVGKETSGLSAIIAALVALAGVFVYGKIEQKRELGEKAQAINTAR